MIIVTLILIATTVYFLAAYMREYKAHEKTMEVLKDDATLLMLAIKNHIDQSGDKYVANAYVRGILALPDKEMSARLIQEFVTKLNFKETDFTQEQNIAMLVHWLAKSWEKEL